MNVFSFLWKLLVIILTISNIYIIFKYFLNRYLIKNNQKIHISLLYLVQPVVLLVAAFCASISHLLKNNNFYELIEILSLNRIDPLITVVFMLSSFFLMFIVFADIDLCSMLACINTIIIATVIYLSFLWITEGLGTILLKETTPLLSALPLEYKIFFVYRTIIIPIIYLVSCFLFWFISKGKIYNENSYGKKIVVDKLKNTVLYFYLILVVGMIYLKLKDIGFFLHRPHIFLGTIVNNSFIFILIYIRFSYYTSNKDNKTELFYNLFKKTNLLIILFPAMFILFSIGYLILKGLEINIFVIIITSILTVATTCIFNVYINRYFSSKH